MKSVNIATHAKSLARVVLKSSINECQTRVTWKCGTLTQFPFLFPKQLCEDVNVNHIGEGEGISVTLFHILFTSINPLKRTPFTDF